MRLTKVSWVSLLVGLCAGAVAAVAAQAAFNLNAGHVWGTDEPTLAFVKPQKCPNCKHELPGQCFVFGVAKHPDGESYNANATVLDYTSKPTLSSVSGHNVPDVNWVGGDNPFSTLIRPSNWPADWTLEHWLEQQRTAFGSK
jgi:hypothetical protein